MAHSDESMVRSGQVREMNRAGNDSADEAAAHGKVSGIPEFGICIGSSLPLQKLL